VVIIEDKNVRVVPYIIFGFLCVIMGTTIYVALPQALLAENASLILDIFFAILIGLILGLTLLTANLRQPFEKLMVYIFFFWESKSMRAILKKNLIAHKGTNKLTSIIYALTLGCVLFLCVSLNLVLNSVTSLTSMPGTDIYVNYGTFTVEALDPVLVKYEKQIKEFSLTSNYIDAMGDAWDVRQVDSTTKQYNVRALVYGVQPSSYLDS